MGLCVFLYWPDCLMPPLMKDFTHLHCSFRSHRFNCRHISSVAAINTEYALHREPEWHVIMRLYWFPCKEVANIQKAAWLSNDWTNSLFFPWESEHVSETSEFYPGVQILLWQPYWERAAVSCCKSQLLRMLACLSYSAWPRNTLEPDPRGCILGTLCTIGPVIPARGCSILWGSASFPTWRKFRSREP